MSLHTERETERTEFELRKAINKATELPRGQKRGISPSLKNENPVFQWSIITAAVSSVVYMP